LAPIQTGKARLSQMKPNKRNPDYPVTLTPDNGTILVTFADVAEATTFGADEAEALIQAVDALDTALSFYVDSGLPPRLTSKPKPGQKTVRLDALV
jgi:antitoxin HicB